MDQPIPVAEIQKSEREKIRVSVNVYRGKLYVSVREFFRAQDGQFLPGRQGLNLRAGLLNEVRAALGSADETIAKLEETSDAGGGEAA